MTAEEKTAVLSRISFHNSIEKLNDVDFAVEVSIYFQFKTNQLQAANEDFNLKHKIFTELAKHTPSHAILASNTSSISISKIAGVVPHRAHQIIGMHFMNPVPVMQLVEVITAL